jgi:hypothetical protein
MSIFLLQVIPLHLPPGDTSTERTLKINGAPEQIESAKQLVNQILTGEVCYRHKFFVLFELSFFVCNMPSLFYV